MIKRGLEALQNDVYEEAEVRRKAYNHYQKMVQKKREAVNLRIAGKQGRTQVYKQGGSWKMDWYGPPEYLEEDMPERECPKQVYSQLRHFLLSRTEDACHEKVVSFLTRFM